MSQSFSDNSSLIGVAIVAKSKVIRVGLESILLPNLESSDGVPLLRGNLEIIGSISTLDLAKLEQLQPDLVLIFWEDGDEELLLSSGLSNFYTIALIEDWQPGAIAKILAAGVRGILPSEASGEEIIGAIASVLLGLIVIHPDLIDSLLTLTNSRSLSLSLTQALTSREIEVLQMLAEGLGNKTIARRLNISEHTVKFHISSIFSKLNVSSRTEAAIAGARQGLIML
jgi:DNA-binding NarL/FixJ family response regulator